MIKLLALINHKRELTKIKHCGHIGGAGGGCPCDKPYTPTLEGVRNLDKMLDEARKCPKCGHDPLAEFKSP